MKKLLIVLCFLFVATSLLAYTYRPIETDWQFITDKNNEGIEKGYLKNDYDTSGLIVKLNYSLKQSVKNKINTFYSNTGKWSRTNTNERIPQI